MTPRFKVGRRVEWPTFTGTRSGQILAILQPGQSVKETLRLLHRDADGVLVNGLDKGSAPRYLVDTMGTSKRFTVSVPDVDRVDSQGKALP